jgi:uncharacterized protein YbaR (Trm112 family)
VTTEGSPEERRRARPDLPFDPSAAAQLACPACRGDLSASGEKLVCRSCARAYPIVDGIPVLIVERAEQAPEQNTPSSGK